MEKRTNEGSSESAQRTNADILESLWRAHAAVRAMKKVFSDGHAIGLFDDERAAENESTIGKGLLGIENQIDALLGIDIEHISNTEPTCVALRLKLVEARLRLT